MESIDSKEQQTEGMDLEPLIPFNVQGNDQINLAANTTADSIEENLQSSVTPAQKKKRKKTKKIKRSAEYPKFYRNAYVRFCDEVRKKLCGENPSLDSVEITKLVAKNWYTLSKEEKQPYLDEAKIDKERFERELKVYKSMNPDDSAVMSDEKEKPSQMKRKKKSNESKQETDQTEPKKEKSVNHVSCISQQPVVALNKLTSDSLPVASTSMYRPQERPSTSQNTIKNDDVLRALIGQNCEIPIFTDTFLEHNKVVEIELKALRKNNIEIEQQNSVLMKHIENMENGVVKVESEITDNRKKNMQLEVYLTKLRVILSANLNSLQIPGWKGGATVENIDKYMTDLLKSSTSIQNKSRDIIKKIDLQI